MRFEPLTEQQMNDAQRAVFSEICSGPRGRLGPPTNVIMRSPELVRHTQRAGEYLRYGSPLSGRIMEFAIMIAARHWNSQYAWHAHSSLAVKAGLSPAVASDLSQGRRPDGMKQDEAAAYDFCKELLDKESVSDPVFDAAVRQFGETGAVDLIGVLAYYTLQCMALKVNQVTAPQGTPLPPLS